MPALAAALLAHCAPDGVAYLMSSRLRFDAARDALLPALEAEGRVVLDDFIIHNSMGRSELVLCTFLPGRAERKLRS